MSLPHRGSSLDFYHDQFLLSVLLLLWRCCPVVHPYPPYVRLACCGMQRTEIILCVFQVQHLSVDVTSAAGNNSCTDGFAEFDEKTGILTGGAVLRAVFSERYDGLPVYFAAKADKEIKSCTITGDETNLVADLNFGALEN